MYPCFSGDPFKSEGFGGDPFGGSDPFGGDTGGFGTAPPKPAAPVPKPSSDWGDEYAVSIDYYGFCGFPFGETTFYQ